MFLCVSSHVLTEDVLYREVTPSNHLLSRRLLTKTNRLPSWAERIFPAHMARAVYVVEDSIVDPHTHTLTTKTWNLNHNTLMVRVLITSFRVHLIVSVCPNCDRPSRGPPLDPTAFPGKAHPCSGCPCWLGLFGSENRSRFS